MQHIERQPKATVTWSRKVVGVRQDDGRAWVEVETPDGKERMEADFIVGCDGANSQVRKSLFGEKSFPGFTWNEQIVATNVSSLERKVVSADMFCRHISILINSAGRTRASSSIRSTPSWLLESAKAQGAKPCGA